MEPSSDRTAILFAFTTDAQAVTQAARSLEIQGFRALVVNVTDRAKLETPPNLETIHISECSDNENDHRSKSTRWMQDVPMQPLASSGRSLLETYQYRGIPLWWLVEINLQEKAFLVVRFIERLKDVISRWNPKAYVTLGRHRLQPWKESVTHKVCDQQGIDRLTLSGVLAPVEPALQFGGRAPGSPIFLHQIEPDLGPWGIFIRTLGRLIKAATGTGIHVLTLVYRWLIITPTRLLTPVARSFLYLILRIVELGVGLAGGVAVALGSFIVWLVALIVTLSTTPLDVSLRDLLANLVTHTKNAVHWSLSVGRRLRDFVLLNLTRLQSGLSQAAFFVRSLPKRTALQGWQVFTAWSRWRAERDLVGSRGLKVMVVLEAGSIRQAIGAANDEYRIYYPYMEGVFESIQEKSGASGARPIGVIYGSAPIVSSFRKTVISRLGKERSHVLQLKELITPKAYAHAERFKIEGEFIWSQLRNDSGFRRALHYEGIDVSDILFQDLDSLFVPGIFDAVLYIEVFGDLLRRVRPAVVLMHNFEGAVRKLCAAAYLEGIRTLGVQHALGPYGHALDHRSAGYSFAEAKLELGWPTPSRIALWGNTHREKFLDFEMPAENLEVTGYARMDTYIRSRAKIDRAAIVKRLGLESFREIVMLAGVLQAGGTNIMLVDRYIATLRELVNLANDRPGLGIMIKPWPGDRIDVLREIARAVGGSKVIFAEPTLNLHNVELLGICDAVLVDFSSLIGEASALGKPVAILAYPESRYYFDDAPLKMVSGLTRRVESPGQIRGAVIDLLERKDSVDTQSEAFASMFGPPDGNSAARIAQLVLDVAQRDAASSPTTVARA